MAHARRPYTTDVELPAEAFRHRRWSADDVSRELRLLWLIDQVRQRHLGYAKAAELAGVAQAEFLRVLGQHRVSAIDLDEEELEREIEVGLALGLP